MGDDKHLDVRVQIDERDAWKVQPDAAATAYLPGNHAMHERLKFQRIEPYVEAKTTSTSEAADGVHQRVLEVVYSLNSTDMPIYIGQHFGVVIAPGNQTEMAKRSD